MDDCGARLVSATRHALSYSRLRPRRILFISKHLEISTPNKLIHPSTVLPNKKKIIDHGVWHSDRSTPLPLPARKPRPHPPLRPQLRPQLRPRLRPQRQSRLRSQRRSRLRPLLRPQRRSRLRSQRRSRLRPQLSPQLRPQLRRLWSPALDNAGQRLLSSCLIGKSGEFFYMFCRGRCRLRLRCRAHSLITSR